MMSLPSRPVLVVAGAVGALALGALFYASRTPSPSPNKANSPSLREVCGDRTPPLIGLIIYLSYNNVVCTAGLDALLAVLRAELELSWPQLVTIRENFLREMRDGLQVDEGDSSMAPSSLSPPHHRLHHSHPHSHYRYHSSFFVDVASLCRSLIVTPLL